MGRDSETQLEVGENFIFTFVPLDMKVGDTPFHI